MFGEGLGVAELVSSNGRGVAPREGHEEGVQVLGRDALPLLQQARAQKVPAQLVTGVGVVNDAELEVMSSVSKFKRRKNAEYVQQKKSHLSLMTENAVLI